MSYCLEDGIVALPSLLAEIDSEKIDRFSQSDDEVKSATFMMDVKVKRGGRGVKTTLTLFNVIGIGERGRSQRPRYSVREAHAEGSGSKDS